MDAQRAIFENGQKIGKDIAHALNMSAVDVDEPMVFYAALLGPVFGHMVARIGKQGTFSLLDTMKNLIDVSGLDEKKPVVQ